MSKSVNGNHVLYHFLQKELRESDYSLFQQMVGRLVASLAIWFSHETYQAMPIALPFAVRDPESRGNKSRGLPDQWGSPNNEGLFRDDNSLVKGLPRQLTIDSPHSLYRNKKMGYGFVASHVWRELTPGSSMAGLASRDPLTYSFLPNLVWLPQQVSKLSDRESSFAQHYLQAVSLALYRNVPFGSRSRQYVDSAWELLPDPEFSELDLPPVETLSFFRHDHGIVSSWKKRVRSVVEGLDRPFEEPAARRKVVSSRYTEGIVRLLPTTRHRLANYLSDYLDSLDPRPNSGGRPTLRHDQ